MRLDLYTNKSKKKILKLLSIKEEFFNRFRGCGIEDGKIIVHTRTGGNNRQDYLDNWTNIRKHPLYLYDGDDEFDNTYAHIYFKLMVKDNE